MIFRLLVGITVLAALILFIRILIADRHGIQKIVISLFISDLRVQSIFVKIRTYVVLLSIIFFVLLLLSGFIPVVITGTNITGIWLIIHVTVAPIFIASFMLFVILSAHNQRFSSTDFEFLKTVSTDKKDLTKQFVFTQKMIFWLFTVIVVPTALSIILQMYPLFNTIGQEFLLDVHRYCALLLFIVSGFYILSVIKLGLKENKNQEIR